MRRFFTLQELHLCAPDTLVPPQNVTSQCFLPDLDSDTDL